MFENATSLRIGGQWIRSIVPGSVQESNGWVIFKCYWAGGGIRKFTVVADEITGVAEDSA